MPRGVARREAVLAPLEVCLPDEVDYVVVVERREDDDWEDDYRQKMSSGSLATLLPILDALGVKLKDRTGGDLVGLRQGGG